MPQYVDGFLLPVPKKKIEEYRKIAKKAAKVWMDHGALDYRECVGNDLKAPFGLAYPKLMNLKPSDTVIFSWITYKSKAHRDKVNKLVMADPRLANMSPDSMPFDCNRMSYGGFDTLVSATQKK